jgi:hypothetical protein
MNAARSVTRVHAYVFLTVATLFSAGVLAGCDANDLIGPENEPEVTNTTDSFQWQVTDLSSVTQFLNYTWVNTGTSADVSQSSSLTAGSAGLEVRDGAGTTVFVGDLSQGGTFQTAPGVAGDWSVRVVLANASGTFNFRLEKP